jgi:RNA polymerase sigma factor (TIGR02999 family)
MARSTPESGRPVASEVTRLLDAIHGGEPRAAEALLPIVYEELRALAAHRLAHEPPGQTLQATALVHEAYLRLVGGRGEAPPSWDNRGHFFAAAAEAMRRILVERARSRGRLKRGGERRRCDLDSGIAMTDDPPAVDLIALDEALRKLHDLDSRKHQVVMLRYFAGLTIEQIAAALGVSPATVKSDWQFARSWLHREVSGEAEAP